MPLPDQNAEPNIREKNAMLNNLPLVIDSIFFDMYISFFDTTVQFIEFKNLDGQRLSQLIQVMDPICSHKHQEIMMA